MSEPITVVLKDSEWLRGKMAWSPLVRDLNESRLFRRDLGRCCCLGLLCVELGMERSLLQDMATPAQLDPDVDPVPDWLLLKDKRGITNPRWVESAMVINDDRETTDAKKVERLNTLAPEHVRFEFREGE